jgi:hypothetical protein
MMDTSSLSLQQRKHLALLRELIVESPVSKDDGTIMSFEEVVAELSRTWLSYGCSIGVDGGGRFKCGSFSHTFLLTNQVHFLRISTPLAVDSNGIVPFYVITVNRWN